VKCETAPTRSTPGMCEKGKGTSSRESLLKETYVYGPAERREVVGQPKREEYG